jgi:hypothetical protein
MKLPLPKFWLKAPKPKTLPVATMILRNTPAGLGKIS